MRLVSVLLAAVVCAPVLSAQPLSFSLRYLDLQTQGTAALWTDFDGDGATDLFFANGQQQHSLYRQVAPGDYRPEVVQLTSRQLTDGVFADLDGDGDRDFLYGSLSGNAYFANEDGSLVERSIPQFSGTIDTRTVEAVDVDADGRLDIFAGTRNQQRNVMLLNTAAGWQQAPGDLSSDFSTSNAACWGDIDRDGDLDLYVANSGGSANRAFRNDGDGALNAWSLGIEEDPLDASTSCLLGDADGDLDLDLFVTVANGRRSRLYLNDGGTFTEAPPEIFPVLEGDVFNASWGDLENDGDLDLVVVGRDEPIRAYLADEGRFTEVVLETERSSDAFCTAVALHDFDGDGDLDVAVSAGDSNSASRSFVLRNNLVEGGDWLKLTLLGDVSNREGIGAEVTVHLRDGDRAWSLRRTMLAHTSRRTQSDIRLHTGLGSARVDSVTVAWPSGRRGVYTGLLSNSSVQLVEPRAVDAQPAPAPAGLSLDVRPNPTSGPLVLTVQSATAGPLVTEVFDVRGRRVWHNVRLAPAAEELRLDLDMRDRSPGVYLVRARRGTAAVSTRFTLGARR